MYNKNPYIVPRRRVYNVKKPKKRSVIYPHMLLTQIPTTTHSFSHGLEHFLLSFVRFPLAFNQMQLSNMTYDYMIESIASQIAFQRAKFFLFMLLACSGTWVPIKENLCATASRTHVDVIDGAVKWKWANICAFLSTGCNHLEEIGLDPSRLS
jgi:hypothetical protein